ncbi:hypothetical protein EHS16_06160, partial [Streptococcus anginosus]
MRTKFAFFSPGYNGKKIDKLILTLTTKHNEYEPTRILPVDTKRDRQYFRIFGKFILTKFVPPHSYFLSTIIKTYGLIITQLHPTSFFTLTIFQHLCKTFVKIIPSIKLFRHYFYPYIDNAKTISSEIIFRARDQIKSAFIVRSG